jgi:hypothetical protein
MVSGTGQVPACLRTALIVMDQNIALSRVESFWRRDKKAMNTEKLREALVELQNQRATLDTAISNIQNVLAMLNGQQSTTVKAPVVDATRTYIDYGVEVLRNSGKLMHVTAIANAIGALRGTTVSRASVESSFIRHIAKTKTPRLTKAPKSMYGLPEWKQQPALVQMAG